MSSARMGQQEPQTSVAASQLGADGGAFSEVYPNLGRVDVPNGEDDQTGL